MNSISHGIIPSRRTASTGTRETKYGTMGSDVGVKIKICYSQKVPLFLKRACNDDSNGTHINGIE